jgi:hypothetical protein
MTRYEDLRNRYSYHPPKGTQERRYNQIRIGCQHLGHLLLETTPDSQEQATALAALDQVMFNANAAIARHERWELRDDWVLVQDKNAQPQEQAWTAPTQGPNAQARDPKIEER